MQTVPVTINSHDFSVVISFSDYEVHAMYSCGQNGRVAICVVVMGVDGDCKLHTLQTVREGPTFGQFEDYMRNALSDIVPASGLDKVMASFHNM